MTLSKLVVLCDPLDKTIEELDSHVQILGADSSVTLGVFHVILQLPRTKLGPDIPILCILYLHPLVPPLHWEREIR